MTNSSIWQLNGDGILVGGSDFSNGTKDAVILLGVWLTEASSKL
jgi:hypothetical protein